ncbi:MAG: tetratricopeptide repeat protein [marine benthic group bacterium]|nr:tetratricopeptide repeat protein [Gemmatimonadota bacterium]MCL7972089.1 tetratricopeptide repeat protein [Candidatus Benthicola marisminoris]MCL7974394.1 tetratricopeptide repeat protein [Gemmatimonadota bacterium]
MAASQVNDYRRLFAEFKRRSVFRVAAMYGATAFVLIEAADLIFPRIPLPEWTVTLVVWLALLGFPVALVLAWAYERTPEGVRQTDPLETAELDAIVAQPARRRWPAGIAALVGIILLCLGAWWTLTRTGPGAQTYESIAVLPFENLSGNPDNQYFSDGLADELLNALSGVEDLKVAGRTSSFSLRDQNLDLRTIGDTLDVETVLEGSVRRSEDRVRITAQLIDAETGYHLWSDEYDRDITDIFQVQEELAQSITRALLPRLRSETEELYRGGTDDLAAWDLYLTCRQNWYSRNIDQLWLAVEQCEEAVARDAEFALAWSGLADAIDALAFRDIRGEQFVPRAMTAAQRAVLLDPELAEGWASWGTLASEMERDWATAELALRRAIERKPSNAYARAMLGDMLRNQGRVKEAIEQQRAALRIDPLSPVIHGVLAISLAAAREYDEARSLFERTLAAGGDQAAARLFLLLDGPEFGLTGDEMAIHAVELARIMRAGQPETAAVLGHAFAATAGGAGTADDSLIAEARQVAQTLIADSVFNARQSAVIFTRLGDEEAAVRWLERASESNDLSLGMASTDPSLDPLRDDPRVQVLMDQLGLPNGYDPAEDGYSAEDGR